MASKTVLLDEDSGEILDDLVQETGLSSSAVVKEGLLALRDRFTEKPSRSAWEIYQSLDLGPGGYSSVPSTEVRRGVREALRRKFGR